MGDARGSEAYRAGRRVATMTIPDPADRPTIRPATRPADAPESTTLVARSPGDLVAMVPLALGFHPRDSVVLITFAPHGAGFHARIDLPLASHEQIEVAELLATAAAANDIRRAAVLVYTEDVAVAEAQGAVVLARLLEVGIEVIDVLRVEDELFFPVPEDGDPGTAYDLASHRFTAEHVFTGGVVERDRSAVADSLVGTDEEDATAVALAATRYADLAMVTAKKPTEPSFWSEEARWLQRCVRGRLAAGTAPAPAEAGRLLVLTSVVATRDVAWSEITRASAGSHVDLWRGLVRRSPRELLPGAAALLAFAAWQHGNGALAWCALDRCLEVDPDYSMAHCIAELLTRAVPPDSWEPIGEDELPVFRESREAS